VRWRPLVRFSGRKNNREISGSGMAENTGDFAGILRGGRRFNCHLWGERIVKINNGTLFINYRFAFRSD
jgi:hypothetical protein